MRAALSAAAVAGLADAQAPDVWGRQPTTVNGCTCTSECGTSVLFKCSAATYCSVGTRTCNGRENSWSLSAGYYDYCVYPPDQAYESKTAEEKKQILLTHAYTDTVSGSFPNPLKLLKSLLGESVMTSFSASADVFPEKNRIKAIHSVGVVGGVKFESSGSHPYTGLFRDGVEHGIIRFSAAKQPGSGGVAPGMGVKFLRDGRPSANFVAMYSLTGQPCSDKSFFEHEWHNHVPTASGFALQFLAKKFWQASYCPQMVGISDLATEKAGEKAARGTFPFMLKFQPLIDSECDCQDYKKCLNNLERKLEIGTKIFEVYAQASPDVGANEHLGTITVTDPFTTSKFGDEQLFFKHQHMETDWSIHPEWLEKIDKNLECGMITASTVVPPISSGCHSPFNNSMLASMKEDDVTV